MLVFAVELQIVRTTCIFLAIFEGGLVRVSKRQARGRWNKTLKNSILWNLHGEFDKDEA